MPEARSLYESLKGIFGMEDVKKAIDKAAGSKGSTPKPSPRSGHYRRSRTAIEQQRRRERFKRDRASKLSSSGNANEDASRKRLTKRMKNPKGGY